MAKIRRSFSEKTEYSISYSSMRGVDLSAETAAHGRDRFAYLENMYRDYNGDGTCAVESVPGFRAVTSFGDPINGLFLQKSNGGEFMLVHAGTKLYRFNVADRNAVAPLSSLKRLENAKSCGFAFGSAFYLLDGRRMTRIDGDGNAAYVTEGSAMPPYVPTTYVNGVEHEQRNLLTDMFREERYVTYPEELAYATPSLKYRITDTENLVCSVVGIDEAPDDGDLFIPAFAEIGGTRYSVSEVSDFAFAQNAWIERVYVAEGVKRIGAFAFYRDTAICEVLLPDSVTEIGGEAFSACTSLARLRLGAALKTIGASALLGCVALTEIEYALDAESFAEIGGADEVGERSFVYSAEYAAIKIRIPLSTPAVVIESLTIGGEEYDFFPELDDDETVTALSVYEVKESALVGAKLVIRGYMHPKKFKFNSQGTNFFTELGDCSAADAILGCRVAECFDGRVFLAGNPLFPNTVFYSSRNETGNNDPTYFGVMNYFNDGVGAFPVTSLLAAGDALAVFKAGDDGGGSIFYHVPKETGLDVLPKIYPVSYVHAGTPALGASISFFDDPLFISENGLLALDKKAINLERSVVCRSHNVNAGLLTEKLAEASLAKWCGYLAVATAGTIYLADSRALFTHATGAYEYEWYVMKGVGTYKNDDYVYRYASRARNGYEAAERDDERTEATVYSAVGEGGDVVYYTLENGVRYEVYKTAERAGGDFSPATVLAAAGGDLLFFGTPSGDVCVFNNDMRGVAPERLTLSDDFDARSYESLMGKVIHRDYYSFNGHAPRYALTTVNDDCGIPAMTKSTVKGSLALKFKAFGKGELSCEVATNGRGYKEAARLGDAKLDFSDLDFSAFAFFGESRFTLPVGEREKGWLEKQISVYSDGYGAPFGLYSISYRFTVKGKIKRKTV